jgi:hypothetical protein
MLLFAGCTVLETREGLGNVVNHCDVDLVAIVVPVHVHAKVSVSVPVNGTFVVFLKNLCKMVGVLPPDILYAKAISTESEQERPPIIFPKARCDIALMVALLVEAFFKDILFKDACLWETVHALLYFDVDCTVVGSQVDEVVGFDYREGGC